MNDAYNCPFPPQDAHVRAHMQAAAIWADSAMPIIMSAEGYKIGRAEIKRAALKFICSMLKRLSSSHHGQCQQPGQSRLTMQQSPSSQESSKYCPCGNRCLPDVSDLVHARNLNARVCVALSGPPTSPVRKGQTHNTVVKCVMQHIYQKQSVLFSSPLPTPSPNST